MTAANPAERTDKDLPYATTFRGETLSWNISSHKAGPHCLIVGPTRGGKTTAIRTLLTEAASRGIPFDGIYPKTIELDGLETEPNRVTNTGDALRAAEFIRALHREMHARVEWVQENWAQPTDLQPLIVAVDEFVILSGKWQRLAKTGDDETGRSSKNSTRSGRGPTSLSLPVRPVSDCCSGCSAPTRACSVVCAAMRATTSVPASASAICRRTARG